MHSPTPQRYATEDYDSDSTLSDVWDERTQQYRVTDTWNPDMEVTRGSAARRLDMRHGFLLHIVSLNVFAAHRQCRCRLLAAPATCSFLSLDSSTGSAVSETYCSSLQPS